MFRNYIKLAWRNITRHKIYTLINMLGLGLGVCACIVIYLITSYEFSFDKFHPEKERIYRVVGELKRGDGKTEFLNCPLPEVAGLEKQIPGFESESGFHFYDGKISIPDGAGPAKKFDNRIEGTYQSSTIITWPQYFSIFKYTWLAGNPQVLDAPFKVVLSETRAHKYFGNIPIRQMIGKTVIYDDSLQVSVAGIVKEWDQNTDFGYTDFISISTGTHSFLKSWITSEDWASLHPHNAMAMVKLMKGTTAAQINQRFAAFIKKNVKIPDPGASLTMRLQSLNDMHFTTEFHRQDDGDDFRKPYLPTLYALMGVAIFILVLAIVNFINLSTAQSIQRSKEIGVRKVMGGKKKNIIFQFLTETFLLTVLSVIISVLLVRPVLTLFSDYIPTGVAFHPFQPSTFIFLLIVTIITTLLAGFYPARILASYLPALSLRGHSPLPASGRLNLRQALIVFQFTISLIFIVTTIIMGRQIHFMNTADKGFNSDAVLVVNHWKDKSGKLRLYAENIRHIPGVNKVILQGNAPMGFGHGGQFFKYKDGDSTARMISFEEGGEDFIPFYQIKLLAGRNITHSDSLNELVINETYSKLLGFPKPQDALGKFIYTHDKPYPIVGVVADFREGSFHDVVMPVVIAKNPQREWSVAIKMDPGVKRSADVATVMSAMEQQWKKLYPEDVFEVHVLNEAIGWLYGQEEKTAWLVNLAMSMTIFISCMGLFGLGMFTAQKRTKEIGVRKVLGATVANIVTMLSKDFIILVLIALLIASPIAWYVMNQWLQDFTARINIGWSAFAIAGAASIFISLVTISFQAIKAATANPVTSLRSE